MGRRQRPKPELLTLPPLLPTTHTPACLCLPPSSLPRIPVCHVHQRRPAGPGLHVPDAGQADAVSERKQTLKVYWHCQCPGHRTDALPAAGGCPPPAVYTPIPASLADTQPTPTLPVPHNSVPQRLCAAAQGQAGPLPRQPERQACGLLGAHGHQPRPQPARGRGAASEHRLSCWPATGVAVPWGRDLRFVVHRCWMLHLVGNAPWGAASAQLHGLFQLLSPWPCLTCRCASRS